MYGQWNHKILGINNGNFEETALEIFRFQAKENPVYKEFTEALMIRPGNVKTLAQIPFLPVRFFKSHSVTTTDFVPETVFESSGTSGMVTSKHFIKDLALYETVVTRCFELSYGPVKDWCIIGLLPSYLERKNSSLICMTDRLIRLSNHPDSGFYLDEQEQLSRVLGKLEKNRQKTLLLGVTFALLDFADRYPRPLQHTVIMETGGMKGRRKEMIREEVHSLLRSAFNLSAIHSEYGMTELLSQAYSKGSGIFQCPPWMRIRVRDDEDPFMVTSSGRGIINVIDLANIYSCSFIATDDAGNLNPDGSFEVLGRVDGSDTRGCSLLTVG